MDLQRICRMLAAQSVTIAALTSDLTDAEAGQDYGVPGWTAKQVMGHLYDEERYDFRVRVFQTMTAPDAPLPSIDPEGWVTAHQYAEQPFATLRDGFLLERRNSIGSLEQYTRTNWKQTLQHPQLAELTAADILWSWVAHDVLHIRQLTEWRYAMVRSQSAPHRVGYAGDW
ncbi:MAG: hypothetical protein RLZZ297_1302 [Chloroflexota bacterium]|jgi:hypothetical protein